MRAALSRFLPDRRRAWSFLLALAVEALIALALLLWRPYLPAKKPDRPLTTFSIAPAPGQEAPKPAQHSETKKRSASDNAAAAAPAKPPVLPIPKPPVPVPPPSSGGLQGVLPIELGSSDIGNIKGSAQGNDTGKDSSAPYGPGEGPGGQPLYNAEWYREPSNAELNGYLPQGAPPNGWALIACRTIPNYHVENCRSLGESPVGSGLSRAMRQAAWQFLVRPPRVGGHVMVGAWVSIRIDFTRRRSDSSGSNDDTPSTDR
jgi:hypothetical protein